MENNVEPVPQKDNKNCYTKRKLWKKVKKDKAIGVKPELKKTKDNAKHKTHMVK